MDFETLVRGAIAGDDRRVADKRIVDTWVRHKVGLELVEIHVQRTIEAQARGDRADNLSNEAIEVLIVWSRDVEIAAADVEDGVVVDKESAVGVLNRRVSGKDSIVWFDD